MSLSVGELSAILDLDTDKYDKGMEQADQKGGKFSNAMGKAGVAAAAGLATAGVAAAGFGVKSVTAASDLNEVASKSGAVFKDQAGEIDKWASGSAKGFGQSKAEALGAASAYGNMFVQLGIGRKEAAGMSMQMTELASDFASFHNAAPTDVIDAMSAAFRGEYDSVQRFVPTINAAAVEQKALAMGLAKTTKELDGQDKAMATQKLLMEGAGDAMGDFDKTNTGLANRIRIAKAATEDFSARVGSQLLPVILQAWDIFEKVAPVVGNTLKGAFDAASGAVKPLTDAVGGFFAGAGNYSLKEAFNAGQAEEDMSKFQGALANAGGAVDAFMGGFQNPDAENRVKGLEGALLSVGQGAGKMFGEVFGGAGNYSLSEAFNAGGAQEDMSRFQALVATIGETLSGIFDRVKEIASQLFGSIQEWMGENEGRISEWQAKISEIVGGVVEVFTLAFEGIGAAFNFITAILMELWDRFGSHILEFAASTFDNILKVISGVLEVIKGVFNVFIGVFTGDWSRAWDGVKQIFSGIWEALGGIVSQALNLIKTILGAAVAVLSLLWTFLWEGIKTTAKAAWDGIVGFVGWGKDKVLEIVRGIGSAVTGAISGAFDGIKSAYIGVINWIIGKWNDLSFSLPSVDVPGLGQVGGMKIDTPNLPMLATGGRIMGAGMAIVGEAGPEAVMLQRGASVVPLPDSGGSSVPVVEIGAIHINGVRDGDSVVAVLPDLERALVQAVGRHG